jgi:hypothetical protein
MDVCVSEREMEMEVVDIGWKEGERSEGGMEFDLDRRGGFMVDGCVT